MTRPVPDIPFKLPNPVTLTLPYPPSTNGIWVRTKRGGVGKSNEYNAWLEHVGWVIAQEKPAKIPGKYRLTIEATRPDKRKRDIDNLIKATSDALQKFSVIEDDHLCQFVSAQWVNGMCTNEAGIRVTIEPEG
jgi:crossover junction endodeoxyribonuclease RusA